MVWFSLLDKQLTPLNRITSAHHNFIILSGLITLEEDVNEG